MAYVPVFVTKATVADFHPLITVAMITDTMIRTAERRVRRDLAKASKLCGVSLTPAILFNTNEAALFREDLEDAAMYACLSGLNSIGQGNTTIGPITQVSGDGMAKTHGYFGGTTLKELLVTAEELYQKTIHDIIQSYFAYGYGPTAKPYGRYNEVYDINYNASDYDNRMNDGNPAGDD